MRRPQGAEFEVATCELSPEMRVMYDRAADYWKLLYKVFACADVGGRKGVIMKTQVRAHASRCSADRRGSGAAAAQRGRTDGKPVSSHGCRAIGRPSRLPPVGL